MRKDRHVPSVPDGWKCPLCGRLNFTKDKTCRFCYLPMYNECPRCHYTFDDDTRFCKYCGSMTAYFMSAANDPKEKRLAKANRKRITGSKE